MSKLKEKTVYKGRITKDRTGANIEFTMPDPPTFTPPKVAPIVVNLDSTRDVRQLALGILGLLDGVTVTDATIALELVECHIKHMQYREFI